MCGICGFLNFGASRVDERLLDAMVHALRHRGPDDEGVFRDAQLGLGHARLSIIDLSAGHQPMGSADENLWITFNGEIYNYIELRRELEERGHCFASHSDTEVILHCYQEYGMECVQRFNGQWAFAIWDKQKQRLFLSRDRLGVRPLYYTWEGGCFFFASEIKALLANQEISREADWIGFDQLLTFWCTLPPRTAFKGIEELPPGHCMSVQNQNPKQWAYWKTLYDRSFCDLNDAEWGEQLRSVLIDAVRLRLRSDVPVGAYLSGGLDSSIVTSIIKKCTNAQLKTFSISFETEEFDERRYQEEAVRHLNTDHHEICATRDDIAAVFPEVVRHVETPLMRSAPAPLFLLSKLVRQHGYKVVLSGEGSDEIFGGYDIYKEAKIRRFWAQQPDSRIRPLLLKRLYPYLPNLQSQPIQYLKAFFQVNPVNVGDPLFSHLPRWELGKRIKTLLSRDVRAAIGTYDALEEIRSSLPGDFTNWHPFLRAQYLETRFLLPGYILSAQGDRVGLAHSVEGRFPFLDHRVVELAARIPPPQKMKVLNEKYILKQAFRELIPPSAVTRPKQPYRAPDVDAFFSQGRPRKEYIVQLLDTERIQTNGIFNPKAVSQLCGKIAATANLGVKDGMALTAILSTQLWLEEFILSPQYSVSY